VRAVRYGLLIGELRSECGAGRGHVEHLANSLDKELRTVDGAALLEDESALKGKPVYRVDGQIVHTDHARWRTS
jgi:hypothetical protein